MNSLRAKVLACTLQNQNYCVPFILALVLLAIGVQIIVFLVFTWRPAWLVVVDRKLNRCTLRYMKGFIWTRPGLWIRA